MKFTPDIIGDLSLEEIRFLKLIPPHTINYDAVVHKTFGVWPGNDVFQFRYDLLSFHDSVTRLAQAAAEISQDITIVAAPNINDEMSEDITIVAAPNIIEGKKSGDITTPDAADEKKEDINTTASNTYDNDEGHDEGYDTAGNGSPTSMKREKKSTNNGPEAPTIVAVASDDKNDEVPPDYTDEFHSMIEKA
ncbi:hypothetical protein PV327_011511 [Microctonus hyperodae]|uniref:Uncharacterized protein n=1 Tax=Microctonus hyperodae TaxID=165561 RepID=A0AA39FHE9_MICHY|nr:hypothetical protein PV327_011511 [Microctonus hyperodae]